MMSITKIVMALSFLALTSASPLSFRGRSISKLTARQSCTPNSDGLSVEIEDQMGQELQLPNGNLTPGTAVVVADVSGVGQFLLLDTNGAQMNIVPAQDPLNTGLEQSGTSLVADAANAESNQLFTFACDMCFAATSGVTFGSLCTIQSVSNNLCVTSFVPNLAVALSECNGSEGQYFNLVAR